MATVGIFAGASEGAPELANASDKFITELAVAGFDFVYGGGRAGTMGVVERTALAHQRHITGVITAAGEGSEIYSSRLSALEVVADRDRRKARIIELADVIVALPGGSGTLEELVDAWSLRRLGASTAACFVFNPAGFYDPLLQQVARMRSDGFVKNGDVGDLKSLSSPAEVSEFIRQFS